ncbi:MAG: ribonuclease [Nocardioidaceae bacterium]|nr:ribonuclease [Nocardioidaceae bacterium]
MSPADALDATEPGAPSTSKSTKSSESSKAKSKASPESAATDTTDTTDKVTTSTSADGSGSDTAADGDPSDPAGDGTSTSSSSRRRRRRRRSGDSVADGAADASEPAAKSAAKTREPKRASDSITSVEGSTRIEAKKQRRREGREAGRRRAPILSESEFLARRESVDRVMVVRQREDVTQIGVLEDDVLVEHYVALEEQGSLIGNVYLGRVQNVLPSMEAAFIDIGKGRNAVLYAGEVNWDLIGDRNQARRIENALKPGQSILVQVSKDPVGHKGARLTSQISLPGRYLVYVPSGGSSGISRKLPDTERNRLKNLLKEILPDESGVIIRTAAEGASEEELTRDVTRLTTRWAEIQKLMKNGKAPALLYAEPDTTLKVVRDLFTEDFTKLVISGDEAWDIIDEYVSNVAPDLADRLERYDGQGDVFAHYRIDEQIAKALERKVWLPSGGSLVIDRTEAMTVVDVNTGKFTGSGGNLEQTVTKNNLEAAEEIVRQLRLRDIGGIIVIDFIDMVLENNRDLVLRRLVECLGRDRTRHQVAEVTSLGLVQMTRKRIGTGLVEAFSVPCEVCHGRGVVIESEPVKSRTDEPAPSGRTSKRASGRSRSTGQAEAPPDVDPLAAERHSAAAAATAAIAAALHPKSDHDADQRVDGQALDAEQVGTADLGAGDAEHVGQGDSPTVEPSVEVGVGTSPAGARDPEVATLDGDGVEPPKPAKSRRTAKTSAPKKAATAKRATATKRSTSRRRSAADAEPAPAPDPVAAS